MRNEEVRQIGGGQTVESFVCEQEYFEGYAGFDGEPVEREEDRGDVVTGSGVGEEAGSRVLNHLKSMEGARGDAGEEGVTVVETGGDEGVDEGFSSRGGEAVSDFCNVAEVKV